MRKMIDGGSLASKLLHKRMMLAIALCAAIWSGCAEAPVRAGSQPPGTPAKIDPAQARRVLLIINDSSEASREIGEFYRTQRQIPGSNVLRVNVPAKEEISQEVYGKSLAIPLQEKLAVLKEPVDFIVTTKGVPIRLQQGGYSVDAFLSCVNKPLEPIANPTESDIRRCINPYFNKNERFSSKKYGFFLVTRLDGYTVQDAKRLVTQSVAAKAHKGPFLFDADPTRTSNGYKIMQDSLLRAADVMKTKGYQVRLDESAQFVSHETPVAGYSSWGSNDRAFDVSAYRSLRFLPGAIGETFVSTSGRTFSPATSGQSLIADLIQGGITGVKGYVSEPYTFALAKPDILFDRYTSGFNLAESFYMSSLVLKWKDVVIGDPLCAPYSKK